MSDDEETGLLKFLSRVILKYPGYVVSVILEISREYTGLNKE